MKKPSLSLAAAILFIHLISVIPLAASVEPDAAVREAQSIQGDVNAAANTIAEIGSGLETGMIYNDANFTGIETSITNSGAKCRTIRSRINSLAEAIPGYAPKPAKTRNSIAFLVEGNREAQKFASDRVKQLQATQAEMRDEVKQLEIDFKNNTFKLAVKTFKKFFKWSTGGPAGMAAEKLWAEIAGGKTELELDAENQAAYVRMMKFLNEQIEALDKEIAAAMKDLDELKKIGVKLEELSAGIIALVNEFPELFGSGSGMTDEAVLEGAMKAGGEAQQKAQEQRLTSLKASAATADTVLASMELEAARLQAAGDTAVAVEGAADSAQALEGEATVTAADRLMAMKADADAKLAAVKAAVEAAQSASSICAGKWTALNWEGKDETAKNSYDAKYVSASDKLAAAVNKGIAAQDRIQAASGRILSSWQAVKSAVESGTAPMESLRGVVEGKPDSTNMAGAYFEENVPDSPVVVRNTAVKEASEKLAAAQAKLDAAQAGFDEACSAGTWYFKGRIMSERPMADADRVGLPYASSMYGTQDGEYPLYRPGFYEEKHAEARAYRDQVSSATDSLNFARGLLYSAQGGTGAMEPPAERAEAKRKKMEALDAILALHEKMAALAKEALENREQNEKASAEAREKSLALIKAALAKYDGFINGKMKNSDLGAVLKADEGVWDASAYSDRELSALAEQVPVKKEQALKKWPQDSTPLIKSAFAGNVSAAHASSGISMMRDNLSGGKYIEFAGTAEPYYEYIRAQSGDKTYSGTPVVRVVVEVNGAQGEAKVTKDLSSTVQWSYRYAPSGDGRLTVKVYAVDSAGNATAAEDRVSFTIDYRDVSVKGAAAERLAAMKDSYEDESVPGFMRQVSDSFYGDRYALEQNLRNFFRDADAVRIEPVVDLAQLEGNRIIVNFHWNRSYNGASGTVTQKEYEAMVLDRNDGNRIIKAEKTLFGTTVNDAPGTGGAARGGTLYLVPDTGGNPDANNMAFFEYGYATIGHPQDPYDIWLIAPMGYIYTNSARNVGIKDLGAVSLDSVGTVPSDRNSYNYSYDAMSAGLKLTEGHTYALTIAGKYFAAFEVIKLVYYTVGGFVDPVANAQILYRFQPSGSPNLR